MTGNDNDQLKARADNIDAKIETLNGWTIIAKDGNVYAVRTAQQAHDLIDNIEQSSK